MDKPFWYYQIPISRAVRISAKLSIRLVGEAFRLPRDGKPVPYKSEIEEIYMLTQKDRFLREAVLECFM